MPARRSIEFYSDSDLKREVNELTSQAEPYRSGFRKDYARLIHSPAFRRLQRKTQLFPGNESDFFRNRITHSLEVSQIAKSIAIRLNYILLQDGYKTAGIDTDLVEFAALAHDLGHPPFGHTGEYALDQRMKSFGGFEGNAQTLRILSRLEKKKTKYAQHRIDGTLEFNDGVDLRAGLNVTSRALASIIKYDQEIPLQRSDDDDLKKGYYATEQDLVSKVKSDVLRGGVVPVGEFQTVEMQIMDIADDIAYSTYDFEDALKAQFTSPLDLLLQVNSNEGMRDAVAKKLFKAKYRRPYVFDYAADEDTRAFSEIKRRMEWAVIDIFFNFFIDIEEKIGKHQIKDGGDRSYYGFIFSLQSQKMSKLTQADGYSRTALTSDMVGHRIKSISIDPNRKYPSLSKVVISDDERFSIDVMKHLTYELHIRSQRLRMIEERGKQIVNDIFECLARDSQGDLLPDDWRSRHSGIKSSPEYHAARMRLISDFIAGMTDSYALEFHSRLKSSNESILFKPM